MERISRAIQGFLHYRTDLGDGMQSAVFFAGCDRKCRRFCDGNLLPARPSEYDSPEKRRYTADELIEYLLEEKKWCASRDLGILFAGGEPLADPWYCLRVARAVKEAGMRVTFRTCGNVLPSDLFIVRSVTDLVLFDFFSVIPAAHRAIAGFPLERSLEALHFLDRNGFPYRLRIHILPDVNERDPAVFASFCKSLNRVKSVILDFTFSSLSGEEQAAYRKAFLEKRIALY